MLKQYGLSKEDENVVKDIYKFMTNALVYYGLLYKQLEKEYSEVWDNIVLLQPVNDDVSNMVNNFLKYKMAKIIKSLYVSKISAELFLSESAYLNKAEQIIQNFCLQTGRQNVLILLIVKQMMRHLLILKTAMQKVMLCSMI